MRLLHEDEPEQWSEYKRKEVEYEKRRYKRVQYYESVRHAEQVALDDIPLPSATSDKPIPATPKINLPPPVLLTNVPPPSSLKKSDDLSDTPANREPPGVPSMIPPNLFEMRDLDSDYESDEKDSDSDEDVPASKKEETPKDKHDKNIEDFIKDVESAQKKKEEEKALELIRIDPTPDVEMEEGIEKPNEIEPQRAMMEPHIKHHEMIPMPPMGLPRIPHLMFRPPPMRPMGIRMPPGPPPNRPNLPIGMNRMGIRMAPGPPLGPPPRHKQHHHNDRNLAQQKDPKSATITAKPQIRNLSADVTRFVPATLRIKRDEPKRPKPKSYIPETKRQPYPAQNQQKQPAKDDVYKKFMNELEGFL